MEMQENNCFVSGFVNAWISLLLEEEYFSLYCLPFNDNIWTKGWKSPIVEKRNY